MTSKAEALRLARERRDADAVARWTAGESINSIAAHYGVDRRTIRQALIDAGLVERGVKDNVTPALDRILALAAEGVPNTWIAEDTGANRKTVSRHAQRVPGRAAMVTEAAGVWIQIARTPALAELHREFAPR